MQVDKWKKQLLLMQNQVTYIVDFLTPNPGCDQTLLATKTRMRTRSVHKPPSSVPSPGVSLPMASRETCTFTVPKLSLKRPGRLTSHPEDVRYIFNKLKNNCIDYLIENMKSILFKLTEKNCIKS